MLSILCVRLTIKVKVGIPESFKLGWYPPKKTGSSYLKRARRDRYVFKSKGNEKQFKHAESVLEKVEGAKNALSVNAISKAKITAIEEGIALVSKRMKLIKIADKSQYSWATVQDVFRTGWLLTR